MEARNSLSGVVRGPAVQADSMRDVNINVAHQAAPAIPVPAQLPLAPANFTNRAAELAILDELIRGHDPVRRLSLAVITGGGGTGKTALGSYWLRRLSDHYDGGALYADLRGHQPDAAARPADVLTAFLRALGTPSAYIPLALDELATLFRSATTGKRMLVLLDNAASAAQVRTLLPGPAPRADGGQGSAEQPARPTLVLVTTRWRLPGLIAEGARFIDVGPLDEESAVTLFGRIAGDDRVAAEPEAARSVVRLCGGLPLAVCVAGAKAVPRTRRSLTRLAAELAAQQRRLTVLAAEDVSVRAVFDASYRALPEELARGYGLLSQIPGQDFGVQVAAACLGIDPDDAGDLLDALCAASLLNETCDQRFRYHDLVRIHAREQAQARSANEAKAAAARAIGWYLEQAVAADLVIMARRWRLNLMYEQARAKPAGFSGPADALAWLELELDGLSAAVQAAYDAGMFTQCWQLCEALWGLFANRNYFRPWIRTHLTGIAAAQADSDRRAEARMRMQLGLALRHLRRLPEAREQYSLALALDRSEGHRLGEATELEQLGLTDLAEARTDEAMRAFTQAREIFRQIGRPRGAAMMTCHIGETHRDAGRYAEAIRDLTEARRMFARLPDQYNEARTVTELGQAALLAGDPVEARRLFEEALEEMVRLDSPYEQARIRAALAVALRRLDDSDSARQHLETALAFYVNLGAPEANSVRLLLSEIAAPEGSPAQAAPDLPA